jgi:hypothetical protein
MNKTVLIILVIFAGAAFLCPSVNAQKSPERNSSKVKGNVFFYPDQPAPTTLFKADLVFSPNPASSQVAVRVQGIRDQVLGEGYQLRIYNQGGVLVQTAEWKAGESLNVSRLDNGSYVVVISKDNLVYSQKLVVSR